MKILSIDTSSSAGSIVLADGEQVLGEINIDSSQTHTVRLIPGIDYLLKSAELAVEQLDAYAVICGPGSFTGVRIGLSVVKGMADTSGKPAIPITAFEAWVQKFPQQQGIIVPLIDARRSEVYAMAFERRGDQFKEVMPGMVEKPARVLSQIDWDDVLFVGSGSSKYRHLILNSGRAQWVIADSDPFLGRAMARAAWHRARLGQWTSALELQAYYLRRSDAEIFWKEK